ncbi:hypothetical protein ABPG72_001585 [Tetrahymena utriculariae]
MNDGNQIQKDLTSQTDQKLIIKQQNNNSKENKQMREKKNQYQDQAFPDTIKDISKNKGDQGRPKKPSKQLRDEENVIKLISMNLAKQECILILNFGGYEFQNKLKTKNKATCLIEKHFGQQYSQESHRMQGGSFKY